MKRIGPLLLAVVMVAGLAGCASVGITRINEAPPHERNCKLEIFTAPGEIKRPYEVVCLLDARTGGSVFDNKTGAGAIQQTRPAACKCGADAMLVERLDSRGVTAFSWGEGRAVIKAIRYTDK